LDKADTLLAAPFFMVQNTQQDYRPKRTVMTFAYCSNLKYLFYGHTGFVTNSALREHRVVHTGERPYACAVCEKTFGMKNNLRVHIQRIHGGGAANKGGYAMGRPIDA
jgi:hypothetical protein